MAERIETVEQYLAGFPPEIRQRLTRVRQILLDVVPGAEEKIRYGMPAVMLAGRYGLHYAGWKKHVGLYPVPVFDEPLEAEVTPLRSGKDSVNLPHAKPLPEQLIARIGAEIARRREG